MFNYQINKHKSLIKLFMSYNKTMKYFAGVLVSPITCFQNGLSYCISNYVFTITLFKLTNLMWVFMFADLKTHKGANFQGSTGGAERKMNVGSPSQFATLTQDKW